jgi:hypothetical protein
MQNDDDRICCSWCSRQTVFCACGKNFGLQDLQAHKQIHPCNWNCKSRTLFLSMAGEQSTSVDNASARAAACLSNRKATAYDFPSGYMRRRPGIHHVRSAALHWVASGESRQRIRLLHLVAKKTKRGKSGKCLAGHHGTQLKQSHPSAEH